MRRSGPPNVTLAIIGARVPAAEARISEVIVPAKKCRSQLDDALGVAVLEQRQDVPFRGERDEAIRVDERDPQVPGGVEGEAVRDPAEVGRPVHLASRPSEPSSRAWSREIRRALDSTT